MPVGRSKLVAYGLLAWPPHFLGYVVVPLLVSVIGRWHGWHGTRPSLWNLGGLVLVWAGSALIVWAIVSHYRSSPERVRFTATPDYVVTEGAYGVTRNPLYLGGGMMWLGWAILCGSLAVTLVGIALFAGLATFGVPFEERMLSRRFGDGYARYRAQVPRWIGRPDRGQPSSESPPA